MMMMMMMLTINGIPSIRGSELEFTSFNPDLRNTVKMCAGVFGAHKNISLFAIM